MRYELYQEYYYYYVDCGVRSVCMWILILFYYVVLFEWLTIVK